MSYDTYLVSYNTYPSYDTVPGFAILEYRIQLWLILPGPSIEHDLEGLWWSSNGDGTIVSNVLVVGERFRLEASFLMEPSSRLTVECS